MQLPLTRAATAVFEQLTYIQLPLCAQDAAPGTYSPIQFVGAALTMPLQLTVTLLPRVAVAVLMLSVRPDATLPLMLIGPLRAIAVQLLAACRRTSYVPDANPSGSGNVQLPLARALLAVFEQLTYIQLPL